MRYKIVSISACILSFLNLLSTTELPMPAKSTKTSITIKNLITQKDTVYRKYFMNHYPDNFTVYVNGSAVPSQEAITIGNKEEFTIIYAYEWNPPWGTIKRAKEVAFKVTDPTQPIDIHFKSWDDTYRIHATNAQAICTQEIKELPLTPLPKKK